MITDEELATLRAQAERATLFAAEVDRLRPFEAQARNLAQQVAVLESRIAELEPHVARGAQVPELRQRIADLDQRARNAEEERDRALLEIKAR